MPDPLDFDRAADQLLSDNQRLAKEQQAPDPFDTAADAVASAHKVGLAASVRVGQQANPDTRARALALADQLRLPVDTVERNLDAVAAKARASQYDLDAIRTNHPQLADWLSNQDHAAVSNDDLPALRQIDVATRSLAGEDPTGLLPHGFLFAGGKVIEPISDGKLANTYDSMEALQAEMQRRGDHEWLDRAQREDAAQALSNRFGPLANVVAGAAGSVRSTQEAIGTVREYDHSNDAIQEASQTLAPGFWGDVQRGTGGVAADLPLMLAGGEFTAGITALTRIGRARASVEALLNATAKGKGAQGAAKLSGERATAANALAKAEANPTLADAVVGSDMGKVALASQPLAIREGLNTADDNGAANGAMSWLIETAVPGAFGRTGAERYLVKGATEAVADGWRGFAKRMLVDAGFEGSEEAVTEWAHAIHEKATGINPHALDPDALWHRLSVAGTVGAVAGAGFSLPANVAEKFGRDGEEAQRATVHADRLQRLMNVVAASKTNGRAEQPIADLIEKSLGQSDRFQYVDTEDFREAYKDPAEMAQALKAMGVGDEFAEAVAAGRKMRIPTTALIQHAAKDLSTAELLQRARRSPDARNAVEAAEFTDQAPDEIRRLSNEARASAEAVKSAPADPVAKIRTEIEDKLLRAGHDPVRAKTNATLMASTFAALGKRSGKDPAELFTAYLDGQIKHVMPKLMKGEKFDQIDAMLERIRSGDVPTDAQINGPSLVDFLREKGLNDAALVGELRSLKESDRTRLPGQKSLIREDGINLDDARQLAAERGYLPKDATLNDFMRLVDDGVRGDSPTYVAGNADPNQKAMREALDQMERALRAAGVDPLTATNKQARAALMRLVDEQDGKALEQGIAPKDNRLDMEAMLKQWRKATGDRTPVGGDKAFEALAAESDAIDAENGRSLHQPAFHGTPHKFDKFTTDHMGSGEGVQAYGWGLYFTGSKEIAKYYRETLTAKRPQGVDGKLYGSSQSDAEEAAARLLMMRDSSPKEFADYDDGGETYLGKIARDINSGIITPASGHIYTVEIPDDGEYLLWDKPLKDQPAKVQKAIAAAFKKNRDEAFLAAVKKFDDGDTKAMKVAGWNVFDYPGAAGALYKRLAELTTPPRASRMLHAAGIPGIKYLDGSSRGKGDGTHNYVIFDGADVAIKEYEQPKGKGGPRGSLVFGKAGTPFTIKLFQSENLSTFSHESAHLALEIMGDLAAAPDATPDLVADYQQVRDWFAANASDIRDQAKALAKDRLADNKPAAAGMADEIHTTSDADIAAIAQAFKAAPADGTAAAYLHEAMHEYFARGFEAYLMEGKAPTPSLRSAFARIKGWLVGIYRTVATLRVQLSPEIRSVFDRLVAIEDEVDAAEDRAGTTDILPASAFPDAATFDAYRLAVQASHDAAEAKLQRELIGDYRKELARAHREQRQEIRTEIADEVNARPVYQVISALQRGELPDGTRLPDEYQGAKIDREELVREWGEAVLDKLPGPGDRANRGAYVYASQGGLPIATVAQAWGFSDPSAMIEAMIAAPDRESLIETLTTARMTKEHPDPLVDGTLPDRADQAIAGDQRGELLAREMRALGSRTGQTPAPVEVLRQMARDTIERQKARDLRPDIYRLAAATAARQATEAAGKQDWGTAYVMKQREALNLELFRAARDAVEEGEKGRAYLRKLDTMESRQRIGKAGGWEFTVYDEDGQEVASFAKEEEARAAAMSANGRSYRRTNGYLEQIDAIQDGYDLRRRSNRSLRKGEQVRKWIEKQKADGEPVDIDPQVVSDLGQRNWNDLTVGEQAAVVDAVRNVVHLAGLKNKLLKASRDADLAAAQAAGSDSIIANKKGSVSSPIGSTPGEDAKAGGRGYLDSHRKDAFVLRAMDGYVDGGPMWDLIQRPRNDAATAEEIRNLENAAQVDAAFREWGKGLGWTRQDIPGTKMRLTLEHRIAIALNWGHAEGRRRILRHLEWDGFNARDVQAVLDSLDAKDLKLVRDLVGIINSHWSDVAALEQRMTGIPPEKVKALPFYTKAGGWQAGGYYPLKYDAKKSHRGGDAAVQAALKENLGTAGARGQTRRSHTKLRAEDVKGLAVDLSIDVAGKHLSEVVHDLTHREMGRDQIQLLKNGTPIADAIIHKWGVGKLKQLVETAGAIATRDITPDTRISSFVKMVRRGNTAAVFTYQLTSALMNLTGVANSVARVGPLHLLSAVGTVLKDASTMEWAGTWVQSKSDMMRVRGGNNVREVSEALREVGRTSGLQQVIRWGYLPMQKVVQAVDTVTWIGAYNQTMEAQLKAGKTEAEADTEAIAIADQTVLDTQGSGRIGDLSAIQRGGELAKLFTMFYGYFNTQANLMGEQVGRAREQGGMNWVKGAAIIATLGPLATIMTNLIKAALRGDDRKEDAKAMAGRMAREQLGTAAGLLVGARELSGAIEGGFDYGGPASLSAVGNASRTVQRIMQIAEDLFDDKTKTEKQREAMALGLGKAAIGTVGSLTGAPSRVANQALDAFLQFEEGEGAFRATRTLLFGKPLKDSKGK